MTSEALTPGSFEKNHSTGTNNQKTECTSVPNMSCLNFDSVTVPSTVEMQDLFGSPALGWCAPADVLFPPLGPNGTPFPGGNSQHAL
mmetsp:Transcript_39054/g.94460  ORF Transcript_39054/g.94460 Transcript_39054/m.94460 type:complete len:87 (+) Transcript_39054:823-1083(+)